MEEIANEVLSLMDQLQMMNYSDDTIDKVKLGEIDEMDNTFTDSILIAIENPELINELNKKLVKIRDDDEQHKFWDIISSQNYSPLIFLPLCAGCITKDPPLQRYACILYSILVGMQPISLLWNSHLFTSVLSIMIAAAQALEAHAVLTEDEINCVNLSMEILPNIQKAFSHESFENIAQIDVIIAIIELVVKFSIVYDKQYESFRHQLNTISNNFLNSLQFHIVPYALRFVVSTLLLDFLPTGKTITKDIEAICNVYLAFCKEKLQDDEEKLVLVIKHLIVRCSERVAVRDNTTKCISILLELLSLEKFSEIISFVLICTKASRSCLRSVSADVIKHTINNDILSPKISEDEYLQLYSSITIMIRDSSASVRSSALDTLSSLWTNPNFNNMNILKDLKIRLRDEKLSVRKASLRLLKTILSNCPVPQAYEWIAERTRDHSVSMRQEAATLLTYCFKEYSKSSPELIVLWFDSIFPLILDTDPKTQELSMKLVSEYFLDRIGTNRGNHLVNELQLTHFDFLKQVLPVYKQKAISLQQVCRNLQNNLESDESTLHAYWKMAVILIEITPEHFKGKKLLEKWDDRFNFPPEYIRLISKLPKKILRKHPDIMESSFNSLSDIIKNNITEKTENTFDLIHSYISIISQICCNDQDDHTKKSKDKSSEHLSQDQFFSSQQQQQPIFDPEYETFGDDLITLLQDLNQRINTVCLDQNCRESDLVPLIPSIYTIGELFSFILNYNDYDFTGLKLLIGNTMPNGLQIPSRVRAITTISLGKLCLNSREISRSFIGAFASQLHESVDSAVKCNCLIALCDLCVTYSAMVDPYIFSMSTCFCDPSPIVRRQSLLIMTRLMSEDFVKMRPIIIFRLFRVLIDPIENVANFARSCLFDVLCSKDPKLLSNIFIDSVMFFNNKLDSSIINEDPETHSKFEIHDKKNRREIFHLLISHMNSTSLIELLVSSCTKVFQQFIEGSIPLGDGSDFLADIIDSMLKMEEQMDATSIGDANTDDPAGEAINEKKNAVLTIYYNHLTTSVFPILNDLNKLLRSNNSPLQSELRKFFKLLCAKNPQLLELMKKEDPILATEIEEDLIKSSTPQATPEFPIPSPPAETKFPFKSPLLTKIAKTPEMMLISPSPATLKKLQSPVLGSQSSPTFWQESLLVDEYEKQKSQENDSKKAPIPFILEE